MRKALILNVLVVFLIVACGPSTKIVKSWRDPSSTISPSPESKIFVIAMVKDESSRRVIEDEIVKRLKVKGVQSYTELTADIIKNQESDALDRLLKSGQYTDVILMRLSDIEKEVNYTPGTTTGMYGGYGGYYRYGAGFYSTPGYYSEDKNYTVETTLYSVNPNKLIWAGTTSTVNPTNIQKTVNEIATVVTEQMKKDGLIATAAK
jgi:hypothetical protein